MQWQIFKGKEAMPETFDDGVWANPGDEAFTQEFVKAEMAARKGDSFSYIGRSTQVHDRNEDQIAPRAAEMLGALQEQRSEQILQETIKAIPDGETRGLSEVLAEVSSKVDAEHEEMAAAARKQVLRDMGLAE